MDVIEIKKKLDRIAEFNAQLDTAMLDRKRLVENLLGPELMAQYDAIDAEFDGKENAVFENVHKLEAEIKEAVLEQGVTVESTLFRAEYNKGRITWDTAQLDGLAILLPELVQARKQGSPFIAIKRKKV